MASCCFWVYFIALDLNPAFECTILHDTPHPSVYLAGNSIHYIYVDDSRYDFFIHPILLADLFR